MIVMQNKNLRGDVVISLVTRMLRGVAAPRFDPPV